MDLLVILGILLDGAMSAEAAELFLGKIGAGTAAIGAGVAVLGAGIGIGKIGGQAMDAIARQPESVGDIRSNMIVAAALIEGVAFFALIISLLVVL